MNRILWLVDPKLIVVVVVAAIVEIIKSIYRNSLKTNQTWMR